MCWSKEKLAGNEIKQVVHDSNKDREMLLKEVEILQQKLKKKNSELTLARTKLRLAKASLMNLKGTVKFQRERIVQLYTHEFHGDA
jgi:hypothetical protein